MTYNILQIKPSILNKIILFRDPNVIPNNYSYSNDEENLYLYYYSKAPNLSSFLISLAITNYLSYLNQVKGLRTFRISFYGDLYTIGEYIIFFNKYSTLISFNFSRIMNIYNSVEGNINKSLEYIFSNEEIDFNYYKKFFEIYEKNELFFIDLMYKLKYNIFSKLKYNIFSDCKKIEDKNLKEEYIRNQSIYFQNIDYQNSSIWFYDMWNPNISRFQGYNDIIDKYLDFLFFQLSSKISINSIPFYHDTNSLISINLCYFFLLKQIIYLNITSNDDDIIFDKNFLDNIYNEISNKDNITINDCKIETYYSNNFNNVKINNNFKEYYNLEYIYHSYIYLLNRKDTNSIIFENKFSYPNYACLKEFFPTFFTFKQLDFYSFTFGNPIAKMMELSYQFILNIRLFMVLCLVLSWFFLFFIFIFITSRVIKQITEPIIRLTEIIDLNKINEKTINKNIFEYKSDDNINEFFLLCKKLIDGEIKDNNFKNKENIEINSNKNMILNNKMILELIENQKSINTVDKEIFLLKQDIFHTSMISTNLAKFRSISNISLNHKNDNEVEENLEANNNEYYENLLNLSDYVYNVREKDRNNNQDKLKKDIFHTSMISTNLAKFRSISNISLNHKNDNDIKNMRKDCKYITYSWYMNAKKNGMFGND